MTSLTPEEIEGMVKVMSLEPVSKEAKIPLRPPGSYKSIAKVALSPMEGEKAPPLAEFTDQEMAKFESLTAQIEVVFGKTKLTLKELAALKEGHFAKL